MNDERWTKEEAEAHAAGAGRGEASRVRDYKAVYRATGDHRRAIASYVSGNKWATENARAVGNLPAGW